jgi:hypothetical protein
MGMAAGRRDRLTALRGEMERAQRIGEFGSGIQGMISSAIARLRSGRHAARYHGVSPGALWNAEAGADPGYYSGGPDDQQLQRAKRMTSHERAVRGAAFAKADRIRDILDNTYGRPNINSFSPVPDSYGTDWSKDFPWTPPTHSREHGYIRAFGRMMADRVAQGLGYGRKTTVDNTVVSTEVPVRGTSESPQPTWFNYRAAKDAEELESKKKAAKAEREAAKAARELARAERAKKSPKSRKK